MKHSELTAALAVARMAAERAGQMIASRWETPLTIRHKGEVDFVTEVDLAAEKIILETISAAFPMDRIIAEESADTLEPHGRTWFVDPLDGTTNFSHALPHFCVSIALTDGHQPQVAVVHDPIRNWTWYATLGGGAWRNGKPLTVTPQTKLGDALLATGFPYDRRATGNNNMPEAAHLLSVCRGLRRAGSAALDLAYVASGWLDGYWEGRLSPWDIAAGVLLVTEAGGTVSHYDGGSLLLTGEQICATNGKVHTQLIQALHLVKS